MKIWRVGGCVRDVMLGLEPKDIDYVVVGATPEEMIEQGYVQVGADFPVFLKDGEEYALARQERKTAPGYHGFETVFDPSITLEDDLIRRDLSINSMAIDDETGELIDPYGGRIDLAAKVLRHTSIAFAEDPLRVLRVARFAARYNDFIVDSGTMSLMRVIVNKGELAHLAKERIYVEFEKAMSEKDPFRFLAMLAECGALDKVFPELFLADWMRIQNVLPKIPNAKARIAYLLIEAIGDVNHLAERMKIPNEIAQVAINVMRVQASVTGVNLIKELVDLFDFLKVSHSTEALYEAVSLAGIIDHQYVYHASLFVHGASAYRTVSFDSLSDEEKTTLKGKQVGEALKKKRERAVWETLYSAQGDKT